MTLKFYLPETRKSKTVKIPKLEGKKRLDFYISDERVMPVVLDYEKFNIIKGYVLGVLGNYVPLEGEEAEEFLEENPEYKKLVEGLVKRENYGLKGRVETELVKLYKDNFNRIIRDYVEEGSYRTVLDREFSDIRMYELTGAFLYLSGIRDVIDEITFRQGLLETIILADLAAENGRLNEGFKEFVLKMYGFR